MIHECPAIPADTSLEAWTIQLSIVRNKSIVDRYAIFEQRQRWQREAENEFLRRRFPNADDTTLTIERIRFRHGDELAEAVTPLLMTRTGDQESVSIR